MSLFKTISYKFYNFKRKGVLQGKIPFCLEDSRHYFTYFKSMRLKKNSLRKPLCFVDSIEDGKAKIKVILLNEGFIKHPMYFGEMPVNEIRKIKTPPLMATFYYSKFLIEEICKNIYKSFFSSNIQKEA